MGNEVYTPGHTPNAAAFMARRTWASHGQFFAPYLPEAQDVLDVGCGPGTITVGMASQIKTGTVWGIDTNVAQIEQAQESAAAQQIGNAHFQVGSCYALPFEDASFDRVFCHALLEHLATPHKALAEYFRVLKPGGIVGVCSPDWDGLLLAPASPELTEAADAYARLQEANGGDLRIGHKLGTYLMETGFQEVHMQARYECYPSLPFIAQYLALQLERNGQDTHAHTFRSWCEHEGGLFAQAWVSAIGMKPQA
ncbi:MAG: methyltransferase domain-containing protein [Nitrospira sp.]|nr:methyltransferase domain-containing protein [Nitrospira sp.]